MSSARIVSAAVVGGIVMFIWGAASHMVLPIGKMGMQSLPAETSLVPQFRSAINERGFYFFPGMDENDMSEAAQKAWAEKLKAGPQGVLIIDPAGSDVMSPKQLGTELASNVLAALVAAIVLSRIPGSRGTRALLGAGLGVLAWLSIDVSYWNWYHFPTAFAAGAMIDQTAGWLFTGIAIALVLGKTAKPAMSFA